jgi:DNA-binding MarR family transcriptional regulator
MKNGGRQYDMKSAPENKDFDLWVVLDQVGDLTSKAREMELNQFQLTKAQASILHRLIMEKQESTIPELAEQTAKELSSVLNLVNRMMKNGLVEKTQNAGERTVITVTPKGRELYMNSTQHSIEMIFSALTDEEKQVMKPLLLKIRNKARQLLGIGFRPMFLMK